jgi:hypothetical protein
MKFIFIFTQNKKDTTNLYSLEIESIFIMKIFISKKIHPHYQISGINGSELPTQFNSMLLELFKISCKVKYGRNP